MATYAITESECELKTVLGNSLFGTLFAVRNLAD